MNYAVVFGSDVFVGTSGILTVEVDDKLIEFFRIREIFRERFPGSYLTVDVDIKDVIGSREVKLFKSKPVVEDSLIQVSYMKKRTLVKRQDGSTVIDIEQLNPNEVPLLSFGPLKDRVGELDAIIRITGDFVAGPFHIIATTNEIKIGANTFKGNLSVGTGGLKVTSRGIGF